MKESAKPKRPIFPNRAIVTAGMPYGNKTLHFGHVGGVFIPADIFARFLRDRIGNENVIFISGTDCYGSAIELGFEKEKKEGFTGNIIDYVKKNNKSQKETLKSYEISLDIFEGSAIGESGKTHTIVSHRIFNELYRKNILYTEHTKQFYDEKENMFLNGRQVIGRCPINGCKSEVAYADECSLGHQFSSSELINPTSLLSGEKPILKPVENWFIDLVKYKSVIRNALNKWKEMPGFRTVLCNVINEFLEDPSIYVKKENLDILDSIKQIPKYKINSDNNKSSCQIIFNNLEDRKKAVDLLKSFGVRCRTGKTIVPMRLSGNIDWGIPVPKQENKKGLTFWVWPESLWAPISFTKTYLNKIKSELSWEDWWKSDDSQVFQFIGEDNIYFYGIAEIILLKALDTDIKLPIIIPNHHLLYGKKKVSSSDAIKPPSVQSLLDYYTSEQLRIHFMNASLGEKSISFNPTSLQGDKGVFDPVLYEGNLLTNVFNRLIRSAFYTLQKINGGSFPLSTPYSQEVIDKCNELILEYENLMYNCKFDKTFELLNIFLRNASKEWAEKSKSQNNDVLNQLIMDTFHIIRTCIVLIHPIAPKGCELVKTYLQVDDKIWNWEFIFKPLEFFKKDNHKFLFLQPRVDFFSKHPSQFKQT